MNLASEDFDYQNARLNEVVEHILRAGIHSGEIANGVILQETRLAEHFEVSRAPIQQALRRLLEDGLVRKVDGRGYAVGEEACDSGSARLHTEISIPTEAADALRGRGSWEKIYRAVESEVVNVMPFGRYRVVESATADHYSIGRTVARDVLSRLEERGFLEKAHRSHWVVPQLTPRLMKYLYEIRRLLEPAALLTAIPLVPIGDIESMRDGLRAAEARYPNLTIDELSRFEQDLHVEILGFCPNGRLLAALRQNQTVLATTTGIFRQYLGIPESEPFLLEHRLVFEHVLVGSVNAAAAALEGHMVSALAKGLKRLAALAELPRPVTPSFLQMLT
jgi:DNA-binding GntR family transcriptional regulator